MILADSFSPSSLPDYNDGSISIFQRLPDETGILDITYYSHFFYDGNERITKFDIGIAKD
jgi:hypothetical protein